MTLIHSTRASTLSARDASAPAASPVDLPPDLQAFLITRHHVVTAAEANRLGLSREIVRRLVKHGVLIRVARGAYVQASMLDSLTLSSDRHVLQARAVLRTRPQQWAASHQTAARVWGLPLLDADVSRIHVVHTEPLGNTRRHPTVTVHTYPGPDLVTEHRGLLTVEPNTAVGTALLSSLPSGVMAADAALHRELVTPESLRAAVERHTRTPGVARARRVVELADGRAESPGESRLRLILLDLGFRAVPQFVVREGGRVVARVDFYLPELGVVLEFDGLLKYRATSRDPAGKSSDVVIAERTRERRIRRLGYGVGRVTWKELGDPRVIEREIREAAAQADLQLIARTGS